LSNRIYATIEAVDEAVATPGWSWFVMPASSRNWLIFLGFNPLRLRLIYGRGLFEMRTKPAQELMWNFSHFIYNRLYFFCNDFFNISWIDKFKSHFSCSFDPPINLIWRTISN
jgi:hypothetical protein